MQKQIGAHSKLAQNNHAAAHLGGSFEGHSGMGSFKQGDISQECTSRSLEKFEGV